MILRIIVTTIPANCGSCESLVIFDNDGSWAVKCKFTGKLVTNLKERREDCLLQVEEKTDAS